MKRYKITYELHNKLFFMILKSNMFLNAYKTFIKKYDYNEVLAIEKL